MTGSRIGLLQATYSTATADAIAALVCRPLRFSSTSGMYPAPTRLQRRIRQNQTHDVAALSGSPDLLKSSGSEGIDRSHKTVARRVCIDGVGFDDRGLVCLGVGDGRRNQLCRESLAAVIPLDEHARERPDPLRRKVCCRSAEWAVCLTRCNGTPSHGLVAHIADQADRYPAIDPRLDLSPTVAAVLAFRFGRRSSPNHAPTALRAATLLKKTREVGPASGVDVTEMELIHASL